MWRLHALPHCNLSLSQNYLLTRRKIVALIVTGFRQVRDMVQDIASPSTGGIIKFVRLAITTKVGAFVSAMETGGKVVGRLIGDLVINLRGQKVASHFRDPMVGRFE